jgi:hypothetical protein
MPPRTQSGIDVMTAGHSVSLMHDAPQCAVADRVAMPRASTAGASRKRQRLDSSFLHGYCSFRIGRVLTCCELGEDAEGEEPEAARVSWKRHVEEGHSQGKCPM